MARDLEVQISYGQLCVFDAKLSSPYNDWDERKRMQGFAWRPGSVAFATLKEAGKYRCRIEFVLRFPGISKMVRTAVKVPFDASPRMPLEIGGVLASQPITAERTCRSLYFIEIDDAEPSFSLHFCDDSTEPEVLRESSVAKRQVVYDMDAQAAQI